MKKHSIATIINFCTNESRFLKACIEQVQLFSKQIIVAVCDHFFDGTPENRELLEQIYKAFPQCQFIEYPYIADEIPKKLLAKIDPAHFWHSLSRLVGFTHLNDKIVSVLFLDADEVPHGGHFTEWLDYSDYRDHTVLKMANFWYFRDPTNQALQHEDSIVFALKKAVRPEYLLTKEERESIYHSPPGPKRRNVTNHGTPMFHHFSWVRTEAEMLKKVRAWGHKGERDWEALVKKEFTEPFKGIDFVHGYRYRIIEPLFNVSEPKFVAQGKPKVKRLDSKEILKLISFAQNGLLRWIKPLLFRDHLRDDK